MIFNSLAFAVFLPIVFALYWSLRRLRPNWQNALLLVASYVFYGWWDWRFLSLIFVSSIVDFCVGLALDRATETRRRRMLLGLSLAVNLGLLGFFKYFGFFVDSFADLLRLVGLQADIRTLNVILPVGISFYTFQTLSYTIDVYRRQIPTTRDPVAFFAFVAFFPQLVAGPIERASNLLPQFRSRRELTPQQASDGLRQILGGLVKKVVVADNLAPHVDHVFANWAGLDGLTLVIGTLLFAFQIYCDFSGYSDIAIGTARLFGFSLMRNFAYPYFSRNIAEFWRRWHISLSTWFRDYVYIPLGGSRAGTSQQLRNVLITFTVSGFWHGANWTFIVWGALHGLYYVPLMLAGRQHRWDASKEQPRLLPGLRELTAMALTFAAVLVAWVFFRADSIGDALGFLLRVVTDPLHVGHGAGHRQYLDPLLYVVVLVAVEWLQRGRKHPLDVAGLPRAVRWGIYLVLSLCLLLIGNFGAVEFIYFQF